MYPVIKENNVAIIREWHELAGEKQWAVHTKETYGSGYCYGYYVTSIEDAERIFEMKTKRGY